MKVIYYFEEYVREHLIGQALREGAKQHGIQFIMRLKSRYGTKYPGPDSTADLTMAYGIKSVKLLADHCAVKQPWALIDKGYIRKARPRPPQINEMTRISINRTYPMIVKDADPIRWEALDIKLKPIRSDPDGYILVAGSSQDFYAYFGVRSENKFHKYLIHQLREITDKEIVFRAKPSYAKEISFQEIAQQMGVTISPTEEKIKQWLEDCFCLVTFASNSACDAIFAGVPVITLGPHISTPITNHRLLDVLEPKQPTTEERLAWAHHLAWEQWTLEDMSSGLVWEHLLPQIKQPTELWWDFRLDMKEGWDSIGEEDECVESSEL